ncbi:uncharacterized protein SCODWIG_02992 [Saccharomycodes ludwigii]|uniref:Uncharacterized protein n=1 Tax=Saccharomycodes ludwigii TaxID=36035 RepID=A0A376B9D1_9ASCO|nr:hypothetical protein SCDLUD_005217 [Saccharomycodes ludwigii]KAH3898877.1 hypothetical protein SCDLUD_005217 [Saccharomycodes ludwigii]SSD61231.1 uncharacterized protein SCODWIG_02992 [Saccharomycodes ludwigii]
MTRTGITEKEIFSSISKTYVAQSYDKLLTIHKNTCKIFDLKNKEMEEPDVIDTVANPTLAYTPLFIDENTKKLGFFLVNKDDETVYLYQDSNITQATGKYIHRAILNINDIALCHGGKILAIGGTDTEIQLINLSDSSSSQVIKAPNSVLNLAFSNVLNVLGVSFIDGSIALYSLSSAIPERVDNGDLKNYVTPNFSVADDDSDKDEFHSCSRIEFGESTGVFACCNNKSISVYQINNLNKAVKKYEHALPILDFKYVGNDNYICLVDESSKCILWHVATETVVYSNTIIPSNSDNINHLTSLCWSKSYTDLNNFNIYCGTTNGTVVYIENILSPENVSIFPTSSTTNTTEKKGVGLFVDDTASEDEHDQNIVDDINNNIDIKTLGDINNDYDVEVSGNKKRAHLDEYDDLDEELNDLKDDNYIDDYENEESGGILSNQHINNKKLKVGSGFANKPLKPWSQASTEFNFTDRRYLTINTVGYVWAVKSNGSHSVTVSFFDKTFKKEYHFEDVHHFDICSLGENGVLLASSTSGTVFYRSHTSDDAKWLKKMPLNSVGNHEIITSIAVTKKYCYIGTSFGKFYTLNMFGFCENLFKMAPVCALVAAPENSRVFMVHSNISGQLLTFSIFDHKKYYQKDQILPCDFKNIFFTQYGDPCLFSQDNNLIILSKWRNQFESRWIPILDVSFEFWRLTGDFNSKIPSGVHCWCLGVNGSCNNTMTYLLVKGSKHYPDFPISVPQEMTVRIPIINRKEVKEILEEKKQDEEDAGIYTDEQGGLELPIQFKAEEEFLRSKVCGEMLRDTLKTDGEMFGDEERDLLILNTTYDKSLLRIIANACSENNTNKALVLAKELKQDKALAAAIKIADRAGMVHLAQMIGELREARYAAEAENV